MNDHVSKPIDPDALFATLLRWARPRPTATPVPKVATTIPGEDSSLPNIAGVNVVDGLNRVAGNQKLYLKLLSQFATQQADSATQIAGALDKKDKQTAERLAHTVKGVAGNLGITDVQAAAQKLEKAIGEEQESVSTLLDQFAVTLRVHVAAIRHALPSTELPQAATTQRVPFDQEKADAAVNRLKTLLEASDGDSQEAFEALQAAVVGVVEKPQLDALSETISKFEFEQALTKLEEIARICKRNGY